MLEQILDTNSIDPAPPSELLPVMVNGTKLGENGFTYPADGCPEDVYIVRSCTDVYGTGTLIYRLPGGVSNWTNADIGTLFEISGGVCFEIYQRVSEAQGAQYSTYYLRAFDIIGDGGCGDCPGIQ